MDDAEKRIELLRDYGYPSEAIPNLLRKTETMSYEKLKKMIMPYRDINNNKSHPRH